MFAGCVGLVILLAIVGLAWSLHPVAGVIAIALLIWVLYKASTTVSKGTDKSAQASGTSFTEDILDDSPIQFAQTREIGKHGVHFPPPPPDTSNSPVWGRLSQLFEVEGEFAREAAFAELLSSDPEFFTENGAERRVVVSLVPDPENPYDKNAVSVWCEGFHIGYMGRADARRFQRPLINRGGRLDTQGRIWARADGGRVRARATFNAPQPAAWTPLGEPPRESEAILPLGAKIQVIGEENFMEVLRPLIKPKQPRPMWVRLQTSFDIRPRSAKERVDVIFDGQQIGWLSDIQSPKILPLVHFLAARNLVAVARGELEGSALSAQACIYVVRAVEVEDEWVESFGPELSPGAISTKDFEWDDDL